MGKNKMIGIGTIILLVMMISAAISGCAASESSNEWSDEQAVKTVYDLNENKFSVESRDGTVLAGPYAWIEEDDVYRYGGEDIRRYFDENTGLYGFIKIGSDEVKIITEAEFQKATPFRDYSAVVKKNGKYYYINKEGTVILGPYAEATPFVRQGSYAIVDVEGDGLLELISRKGTILIRDCSRINEIDEDSLDSFFSGVKNGHPFIFHDTGTGYDGIEIVYGGENEDDIGPVIFDAFAVVWKNGKQGVINEDGSNIIVPVNYTKIETDYLKLEDETWDVIFLATREDGTVDVFRMKKTDSVLEEFETGSHVEYTETEAWLVLKDGTRIGPFRSISSYVSNNIAQFISNEGLYGFINVSNGELVVPAEYEYGSTMFEAALVKEKGGYRYVLNDRTMSPLFEYAEPMEGHFGRVEENNGKWKIVWFDKNGFSTVDSGFDMLNPLPDVTDIGSGMRNGKAVIFSIGEDDNGGYNYRVIKEGLPYDEIDTMWLNDYALIKKRGEGTGVVSYKGEEIMPPEYSDITVADKIYDESDGERYLFIGEKDGTNEVKVWILR